MRSITRLFGALGTLADSLLSLASVIDVAAARLRLSLAAEAPEQVAYGPFESEISQPERNGAIAEEQPAPVKGRRRG